MRSNGERVFFCSSATQGDRMTPYAASIAYQFDTKKEAKNKMKSLENQYVGLVNWTVFQHI